MEFRFIDLFCGIGGFHQALAKFGGTCELACDIDQKAASVYQSNFNARFFVPDIFELKTDELAKCDILTAGFPCQPFSISGKHGGFSDDRSTVFPELIRIITETRPDIFILENVKYIQHIDGGKAFRNINEQLGNLRYHVEWKLLNARDFGVAQNRERVFWIGTKRRPFEFESLQVSRKFRTIREEMDANGPFEYLSEPFTLIKEPKKQPSGLKFVGYRNKKIRVAGVRPNAEHLSRVHKQPNRIYSIDGIHPTLPSQESSGRFWILLDDGRVRKLTLNECYRLMGFHGSFKNECNSGTQYVQIGNSVCVPVVEAITEQLINQGHLNATIRYQKAI